MSGAHQRIDGGPQLRNKSFMPGELQHMDDELHINEPAGQQLYIQLAFGRLMRGHVLAHVGDFGPGLVDIAPGVQNIGNDAPHFAACGIRSEEQPGTGQRHMLPRPRIFPLILAEAFDRGAEQTVGARGPQAGVDLIQRTGCGRHAQRCDDALRQPVIILGGTQGPRAVGFGEMVAGEEQDEVKVRRMGQRLAAKPSERENDKLAVRNLAMGLFKLGHGGGGQGLQRRLGQMGIAARDIERVVAPFDQLDAQREAFLAHIVADDVESGLIICGPDPALHRDEKPGYIARQIHGAGVDQRVEIAALPPEVIGQRGGIAQDIGHQLQQSGPRLQQAEHVDRARHRLDHIVEAGNRAVGIGGVGNRLQQGRQHSLERIARRRAADRADIAAAPAGHALHHRRRIGITKIGELFLQRQAVFGHARPLAAAGVHHPVVDRGHRCRDGPDDLDQGVGIGQPVQPRDGIGGVAIVGDAVCLPVAVHLQAMFDGPQLFIGRA